MLFADGTDLTQFAPQWVLAVVGSVLALMAAVPAIYGLVKLWTHIRDTMRTQAAADEAEEKKKLDAAEAKAVAGQAGLIQRLVSQVEGLVKDLGEEKRLCANLDKMVHACERERASLRSMLKIIATWGKKRGMPTSNELENLINEDAGSGPHMPLAEDGDDNS